MSKKSRKFKEKLHFFFVIKDETNGDIENAPEIIQNAFSSWRQHWDQLDNKEVIVTETKVLEMARNGFDKKPLFVLQEFEGEVFEYLNANEFSVIGPRCLLDCLPNNIQIPLTRSPVFTIAMMGMQVCVSGMKQPELKKISNLIGYMGGIYFEELNASCTHLVSCTVTSVKYEKAVEAKIKIMRPSWVEDVWNKSRNSYCTADDEQFKIHKLPIFYELVVSSTGLLAKTRSSVKELIENNGGTYSGAFQSEKTDILILDRKSTSSAKFNSALKYKKHCLTPDWVYDSVKEGFAVAMDPYKVSRTQAFQVSTPTKQNTSKATSDFNLDGTDLSEISVVSANKNATINETISSRISASSVVSNPECSMRTRSTGSRSSKVPEYMSLLDKLVISKVKKGGGFLDGCKIYLSGFNPEAKEKLIKILNAADATRFDDLNNQVTHVIVGEYCLNDVLIMSSKKLSPYLLSVDWLVESIKRKEALSEELFLYKEKSEVVDEAPSPSSKKAIKSLNYSFKRPIVPPKLDYKTHQASSSVSKEPAGSSVKSNKALQFAIEDPNEKDGELMSQYLSQHSETSSETLTDAKFFENKTLFLFEFNKDEEATLVEDIEEAKGIVVNEEYQGVVDYTITPIKASRKRIPVKSKAVFSDIFLEAAFHEKEIPASNYFFKPIFYSDDDPKPLSGQNICISSYVGNERLFIVNLAEILGAEVNDLYEKRAKPILVCPSPEGSKYNAAKKWKLHAVTKDWLLECYKTGIMCDLERFSVDLQANNSKGMEQSSVEMTMVPALAPSNAADDIDFYSSSLAPPVDKTLSKMTSPDLSRYAQNLIERNALASQKLIENINDCSESESSDYVIPHRRLAELKDNSMGSPSTGHSNISNTVNQLDLDTPTRNILKKVLKEDENKETPNTRQMRRLMATPRGKHKDGDQDRTFEIPACPETPDVVYGFDPNASPATRLAQKRRLETFDKYYLPLDKKECRRSTPFSEHKKKFFDNLKLDLELQSPETASDPSQSGVSSSTPVAAPSSARLVKRCILNQPPSTIEVGQDDPLQSFAKFVNSIDQPRETPENMYHRMPDSETFEPANTEMLNIESQHDHDVVWKEPVTKKKKLHKFMYTNMNESTKQLLAEKVLKLGGENLVSTGLDMNCTHIVVEKPNRGEKVLASIASGRWVLCPKYIEDSIKAGKFLNEEEYEWGNPAFQSNESLNVIEKTVADAAYKWRKKLITSGQPGAFHKFRVLFYSNAKIDAFTRIIEAGNGKVLRIEGPPYHDKNTAREATHCFIDAKTKFSKADELDMKKLQSYGVQVLLLNYLNAYLTEDDVDFTKYSVTLNH